MVIGINPFRVYGRMRNHWGQTQDLVNSMEVSKTNVIPGLPQGTKYSDLPEDLQNIMFEQSMMTVILLDLVKSLGLSEKTVLIIE